MGSEYHNPDQAKRQSATRATEIPEALRSMRRWMGTRFERRKDGKTDKPPYRVVSGLPVIKADKTNPDNWATFEEASGAYQRGEVDAIGFVFIKDDALFVADCDHVIDPETGEIDPAAADVIHVLDSYTELSCSGTGAHVVGYGTKPEYAGCKSGKLGFDVEVYDSARFVVMTGERMTEVTEVKDRQEELLVLCRELWPKSEKLYSGRPEHPGPVDLEDQELLERARRSRTGAKFRKLYDQGDSSGFASASEADFSLLNMLIFWAAGDRERIIRLFEASALYRHKEKHRNYSRLSVDNALASYAGSFYRPRTVKKARHEDPTDPLTPYLKVLLNPALWGGRKGASAYKTYTAAVIRAAEDGVVDDEGNLRIGCDTRTLAEIAGTRQATVCESGLPHLMQEMKLVSWRRGKGRQASTLVLLNPEKWPNRINKVSTHFIDTVSGNPKHALETLRLLIRMRRGYDKSRNLLRLGMPAMFTAIALATAPRRGQNITELAERTGRSKYDLKKVLKRLKVAGIVREVSGDVYRLTDDFETQYERELQESGVTQVERIQRGQHARDRQRRDEKIPVDKQPRPLRGKDQMRHIIERKRKEARRQRTNERLTEEERIQSRLSADEANERVELLKGQGMREDYAVAEVMNRLRREE
jgi:DNA-binding MarR family transcriptional regulator